MKKGKSRSSKKQEKNHNGFMSILDPAIYTVIEAIYDVIDCKKAA